MSPIRILPLLAVLLLAALVSDASAQVTRPQTPAEPAATDRPAVDTLARYDEAALMSRISYPEIARNNGIEGTVTVAVHVDPSGRVVDAQIEKSDNLIFNKTALQAIRLTTFEPAKRSGVAVDSWLTIPVRFYLAP